MPYFTRSGRLQSSRSIGHVPIVENELISARLQDFRVFNPEAEVGISPKLIVCADALALPGEPVRWVMSFDGSPQEVAVRERYPSTRIGYIQIAGVLVHLEEMLRQGKEQFVDPAVIRKATQEALHSMVLPGSNVCRQDMATVKDSWRAEVYEIFRDYRVEDSSLLDVYMLLVGYSDKRSPGGGVIVARCPAAASCKIGDIEVPVDGTTCPGCGGRVFPTDALRIHEEVSEEHGNATALGRLMTCLEHITIVAYLHFLARRLPRALGIVAFILDGPLTLFGPQAWLHSPILAFIHDLYRVLAEDNKKSPVIIGIEKSGQFAEHADAIGDRIKPGCLMMLPDKYIYDHILTFRSSSSAAFGRDTYYGQKFFYKTARGQLLTITVPKTNKDTASPHDPREYELLPDALALLDRVGTALYKDAVIPIALAHNYASIPLRTGSKVLKLLAQGQLGVNQEDGEGVER
ncbi:MAG: hypothetical protein AB1402_04190 [Bacillota bacterium]